MLKKLLRCISMLLVLVLLVNVVPAQAFATLELDATDQVEIKPIQPVDSKATIVQEISEKRSEYIKEFLLSNGLHMATVYAEPVHYEKDGKWEDIDNTLTLSSGAYKNTAGPWEVSFPQSFGSNQSISVTKDGYTLSFGMPQKLSIGGNGGAEIMSANSTAETFAVSEATVAIAQIENKTELLAEKLETEHPETVLDKLSSRLTYANIHADTDVVYDLESTRVKESIVLEKQDDTLRGYRYTLNVGTMVPALQDDGSIIFYAPDSETVVMVMPAPYLQDDALEISTNVTVTLTGSGSTYTLTYILPMQWLANENRQWPVILDPVIEADLDVDNIIDAVIASNHTYSYTNPYLDIGLGTTYGVKRSFLKYSTLPALTSADVVVEATMTMKQLYYRSISIPAEVHKVTGDWHSTTITWANQPGYDPIVVDLVMGHDPVEYQWDVTDIVQDWYNTGNNYGMMFKAPESVETGNVEKFRQFASSEYDVVHRPALNIVFRNSNGLEDYWDYTSSSAGRAGTAYVNNYCGNLVLTRDLMGFDGNRAPVSISLTYNSNDVADGNTFGFGNGWRSNYNQLVYQWSENTDYYVWEDEDGTAHYFEYVASGTYEDEDNLGLTLTTTGSGTQKYAIADESGNVSYFDTYGRLRSIVNNQQTPSGITITYKTFATGNKRINTIIDGVGRVYQFFYANALASNLVYTATGTETIAEVSFAYDASQNLTNVTDIDGNGTVYTYNSKKLLTSAQDVDGYKLSFEYNLLVSAMPSRVSKVTEYAGSTEGGFITFSYANNQTSMTDKTGSNLILQFNDYGNITSVQDDQGRAQFFNYTSNNHTDSGKGNQLILSSNLQNTVANVLDDSSFENGNSLWHPVGNAGSFYTPSVTECYLGSKALQIPAQADATTNGISVANNQSITFSAYVKAGTSSARLELATASGTISQTESLAAGSGWVRLQTSYTNTTGTTLTVSPVICNLGEGNIYVDAVQLEYDLTANRYNLIQNGDFRNGLNGWTATGTTADDGITTATAAASQLDNTIYRFAGNPESQKKLSQTIAVNGVEGDSFVLAGWAKGDSIPLGTDNREFGVRIIFNYSEEFTPEEGETDGTSVAQFNPDVDATVNWQFSAIEAVASAAYDSVTVELVYDYNANEVLFDGIQVYKEKFGTSYTYDGNGKINSVTDWQGQNTTYEYDNSNLMEIIQNGNATMSYWYDAFHNITTIVTEAGLKYRFVYDTYGNNTSVTITHNESNKSVATSTAYSTDGNYIVSSTDELGKVTKYSHNADTGVLEWIQYPQDTDGTNGTADTRTYYTYDDMYRMTGVAATTDTGLELSAYYTYTDDLLTSLRSPSTIYNFVYGDFAQITDISIGSQEFVSYEYDAHNRLNILDYANGDSIEYTYDEQGNVILEEYEDGDTISYLYDSNGHLVQKVDSATGITTTYSYDSPGQLIKYAEIGPNHNHGVIYNYNEDGQLISKTENLNNVKRTFDYAYDEDGHITSMSEGSINVTYTYDVFDRVCEQSFSAGDTNIRTNTIVYNGSGTTTSEQVSEYNGFTYTYDGNGNILSVNDGTHTTTYEYDTANQLVRENNPVAGYTHTWTYDNAGNILSRTEYAYTTGTLGEAVKTVSYTYGNTNWGDLLTAYDGKAITYDANGNPLNDGTWSYTWQHGRQLAAMTSDNTTWTYTYNADGLRTKRIDSSSVHTYSYVYDGTQLSCMKREYNGEILFFTYRDDGKPFTVFYDGETFFYVTNLQGDVVALLDENGEEVVSYSYDAWGKLLSCTGTMADTLGFFNPLRYRGYVYDTETGLYYLQSRYYNPDVGRFINANNPSLSSEVLTHNLFAFNYKRNNFMQAIGNINIGFLKSSQANTQAILYDVPLYDQNGYSLCWAFCQIMVEDFNAGLYHNNDEATALAIELAVEVNGEIYWNSGGWPTNVSNWSMCLGMPIPSMTELYFILVEYGPVYAYYSNEGAHLIVITGVDLERGLIYSNNPWGISGKQTYGEFLNGFVGMPSNLNMKFGFLLIPDL